MSAWSRGCNFFCCFSAKTFLRKSHNLLKLEADVPASCAHWVPLDADLVRKTVHVPF